VSAGFGTRDHARAAIQLLSGAAIPERVVFRHLGWRELPSGWAYLHAGGAIGPDGPDGPVADGMETRLDEALARYILPEPPDGDELREAVRASLRLLEVAPDHLSVPVLAAAYRAVLGDTDFGLHLAGPTGVFKTELAALAQQHFGPGLDARHLPASWSSTANALEALAFLAKDAILVVDDFAPTGSAVDIARLHRDADRLFRGQGNHAGRGRMRADTSLRASRPPRGLIVSTGEDVPRGQSLRARLLVLEVGPRDIDPGWLSACQADAAAGRYAAAMSGFVAWVGPRYAEFRTAMRAEAVSLRARAQASAAHRRTPAIVASLMIGIETFLAFASAIGAVTIEDRASVASRCWRALGRAALAQGEQQISGDPASRFLELLSAAIASGRAHVAGEDGADPAAASVWGWRADPQRHDGFETWRPIGHRVGWVVGDDLFLDPDASFVAAQTVGRDVGDPLAVQPSTLRKRLRDAGVLASVDDVRDRLTVRRVLEGKRRVVLHLAASFLEGPAHPAQPAHGEPDHAADASFRWAGARSAEPGPGHGSDPGPTHAERDGEGDGTDGPDGPIARGEDDEREDEARAAERAEPWTQPPLGLSAEIPMEDARPQPDDWGTVG
jgi:hypothetical protein